MKLKLPKVNLVFVSRFVLLLLGLGAFFGAGFLVGSKVVTVSNQKPHVTISRQLPVGRQDLDFSLFWDVWDRLETSFLDPTRLEKDELVYGAIRGLVASIGDPYTVFLAPDENQVVEEDLSGNFEGVGIQIGFKGTQLAVVTPLPETPAAKAGVKAGDYIIAIKDTKKEIEMGTVGLSLPEAVEAIRGPAGSQVTLTLLRQGVEEPIEVTITRASIDVPSVIVEYVDSVAQIKVLKFGGSTNSEWEKAVRDVLTNSGVKAIVLDLRNNPGGYLQGAIDIAGEFVDPGEVIVIQEDAKGDRQEFKSAGLSRFKRMPIVVLVNEGSASASEILAGALRDIRGIKVVGTTTFGKGTIQEPQALPGGASLHVTTAKWLTPKDFWVDDQGLEPDVLVEDDLETQEDEQLLKAIELVRQ